MSEELSGDGGHALIRDFEGSGIKALSDAERTR